jgi:hypothetical protein
MSKRHSVNYVREMERKEDKGKKSMKDIKKEDLVSKGNRRKMVRGKEEKGRELNLNRMKERLRNKTEKKSSRQLD